MLQNAGMDATTQFEDINHSDKARVFMKDLYIGDFYNPEADKESWEDYVKRKQKEEEGAMSPTLKFFLIAIFVMTVTLMYNYLMVTDEVKKDL